MRPPVRLPRRTLLTLLPLALVGCKSSGLGSVPESVVELYDAADPIGMMELELDRDGKLVEVEADVSVADVPMHLREMLAREFPGSMLSGAEREIDADGHYWELKFRFEGRAYELVVDDEGKIHETEMEITFAEAPPAVLAGADAAVAGGYRKSVETVTRGEEVHYHVKKDVGGASYKIVLDADGNVVRKVREQRAEIEIPLAD